MNITTDIQKQLMHGFGVVTQLNQTHRLSPGGILQSNKRMKTFKLK